MFRILSKILLVVKRQKKFRTLLHVRKFENDDYRERYKIRLRGTIGKLLIQSYTSHDKDFVSIYTNYLNYNFIIFRDSFIMD